MTDNNKNNYRSCGCGWSYYPHPPWCTQMGPAVLAVCYPLPGSFQNLPKGPDWKFASLAIRQLSLSRGGELAQPVCQFVPHPSPSPWCMHQLPSRSVQTQKPSPVPDAGCAVTFGSLTATNYLPGQDSVELGVHAATAWDRTNRLAGSCGRTSRWHRILQCTLQVPYIRQLHTLTTHNLPSLRCRRRRGST